VNKAITLLKQRLAQGELLMLAAKKVSDELGFGPAGYAKLIMAYKEENQAHNWTH
jgi:hypothetical protein